MRSHHVLFALFLLLLRPGFAGAAPHLAYIYPPGGQRGTTVKVTFSGSELAGVTALYTTGAGITAKVESGGDAAARSVDITIAKDAPLGIQQIRLYGPGGMSNARFFSVGQWPERLEQEPNDTLKDATRVSLPITINGRIQQGTDRDGAAFTAKAGQTVVCEIQALRILGQIGDSWLKGYMEIQDSQGHVLASSEGTSDDYYRWDPVIAFTPTQDGEYTVFFRDLNWRGAPMAVYRLTIGVVPEAFGIFPLGGQRGKTALVHFFGPNLQDASRSLTLPKDDLTDEILVDAAAPSGVTNSRPFQISDLPDALQTGDNHRSETAQTVPFPCVVNGRIEKDGLHDFYRFQLAKPQRIALEVWSRRLGTPMDSEIALYDAQGKLLQADDDARGRDSRLERDLPPGQYTVRVRDIDDRGGMAFPYRLFVAPPQPRLRLVAIPDAPLLQKGSSTSLTIRVERLDGLDGDVTVTVQGLPTGLTAAPLTISKGQQEGKLTLTSTADAPSGPVRLEIIGSSKAGDRTLRTLASTTETYNIQGTAYQRELIGPILCLTPK